MAGRNPELKRLYKAELKLEPFCSGGAVAVSRDGRNLACACYEEVKVSPIYINCVCVCFFVFICLFCVCTTCVCIFSYVFSFCSGPYLSLSLLVSVCARLRMPEMCLSLSVSSVCLCLFLCTRLAHLSSGLCLCTDGLPIIDSILYLVHTHMTNFWQGPGTCTSHRDMFVSTGQSVRSGQIVVFYSLQPIYGIQENDILYLNRVLPRVGCGEVCWSGHQDAQHGDYYARL